MKTIRDCLRYGESQLLLGPHAEKARLDAELLLRHLLDKDRAWLMAHANDELSSDLWSQYSELVRRRVMGEPVQYIIGECEFYGLPFYVTPDVLIPRPETEVLVDAAIQLLMRNQIMRVVDVGTGSGAIAVAIAKALPDVRVYGIDISQAALLVARRNALRNGVDVEYWHGDLLTTAGVPQRTLIVSNPPYVPAADRDSLSVEVRDYEPALALFAGEDGLDVYRRLIPQGSHELDAGGHLMLEIGYGQAKAVGELMERAQFCNLHFVSDLQGIPRVIEGVRRSTRD